MMNLDEAKVAIESRITADLDQRAQRLVELDELLNGDWDGPFSAATDASLIFEDVKATWIDGALTATVMTSHAYCRLQLMSRLLLSGQPARDESVGDLAAIAQHARDTGLIEVETLARVLELHDLFRTYTRSAAATGTGRILDTHLGEKERSFGGDAFLSDAREALSTAVALAIQARGTTLL
jgi:hypothetical protein